MAFLDDLKQKYDNFSTEKLLEALQGKRDFSTIADTEEQPQVEAPVDYPVPALPSPTPGPIPQSMTPAMSTEEPVQEMEEESSVPTPTPNHSPLKNSIDFGTPSEDFKNSLGEAQKQRDLSQLLARIGGASDRIGASLAGGLDGRSVAVQPTGQEFYKDLEKSAGQPIQDIQQRMEIAKQAPESAKGLKDFLQQRFGLKIQGDPTPEQLKEILPSLNISEQLKVKKEMARSVRESKDEGKEQLQKNRDMTRLTKFSEKINPNIASSRSGFGKDLINYNTIQNAKALIEGTTDLNQIDTRQISELARVLDRVLSSGSPTISGTEHLTPDTAKMKIAKLMEFMTSKTKGAGAADFVKKFQHTLQREEDVAKDRLQKTKGEISSPYKDLYDKYPEEVSDVLRRQGLEPEDIFGAGYGKQKATRTPSSDTKKKETKVVNGVTYEKVDGGWSRI